MFLVHHLLHYSWPHMLPLPDLKRPTENNVEISKHMAVGRHYKTKQLLIWYKLKQKVNKLGIKQLLGV